MTNPHTEELREAILDIVYKATGGGVEELVAANELLELFTSHHQATLTGAVKKAREQGFYAAMGMCGVDKGGVHGYYVMYTDALTNPKLIKKAAELTNPNKGGSHE